MSISMLTSSRIRDTSVLIHAVMDFLLTTWWSRYRSRVGLLHMYRVSVPSRDNCHTIRYDTRCYFNVRSKANMSQLILPHGTDN